MARTIKGNELAIQSYIFTTAKYDFNAYEKRIMYRLVEFAQDEIKGIMIRDNMHKITPTLFGREITMPVADILRNEKDQNYTIAKKAFRSLAQKGVEYEDDKIWQYTSIISSPKINKVKGSVVFKLRMTFGGACWTLQKAIGSMSLLPPCSSNPSILCACTN